MLTAIRNWVIRTMMKAKGETGIVKTLPKKEIVEINTQITAQRLMENGIDPQSLKNADQVENAIIAIENRKNVQTGFTTKKSADVFDLEGRKIDTSKGIMGGRQIPDDDLPPPGSRGGDDDIAAPIQSEDEILEKLNRENKEARRNLQIKLSKDKGYQKYKGETEEEIRKRFGLDDPEDMAQGGRAGFANGTGAPSITLGPKEEPMGPRFETNDPGKAAKEIIRRLIKVEGAQIPLTKKGLLSLNIDNLDKQSLGGIIDLLGGQLQFGVGRDEKVKVLDLLLENNLRMALA